MRKSKMRLPPKTVLRLSLLPLALLFVFCNDEKSAEPEEEKTLLAVRPSVLEAGTRALVSMAGEHTAFGDSVWLEKNGHRIHGTRQGSGTDISLVAEFEIPENASPGSWDAVVQDKARDSATRLAKGITLIPALAWIRGISPAKLTTARTHRIEIKMTGVVLGNSETQVRFSQDADSLGLKNIAVLDDTTIAASVTVAGTVYTGAWTWRWRCLRAA